MFSEMPAMVTNCDTDPLKCPCGSLWVVSDLHREDFDISP